MAADSIRVMHSCVDGAGFYPERFTGFQDAIWFASGKAQDSESHGNPYGYQYHVIVSYGPRSLWYHVTQDRDVKLVRDSADRY